MSLLKQSIRTLHPSYFAMVMGTGIVSIAFERLGVHGLAYALFLLNAVLYLLLSGMALVRLVAFTTDFLEDISKPRRSWPYLTFVVGNNTIGSQLIIFWQAMELAWFVWVLGVCFWLWFIYYLLFNLVTRPQTDIRDTVDGATLLVAVSTASVALLGVRLIGSLDGQDTAFLFAMWCFWALSFVLYVVLITCVLYRKLSRDFGPDDWHGPYWICMGAAAIVTLTGALLVPELAARREWAAFVEPTTALTALAWAVGTWWIPYQIIMDIWHFRRFGVQGPLPLWIWLFPWARLAFGRENHCYQPPSWARVFPMGMYAACTVTLAELMRIEALAGLAAGWIWAALLIWVLTFIGTVRTVVAAFTRAQLSAYRPMAQ
jgi:tellurite resistance protein TehA-like permease